MSRKRSTRRTDFGRRLPNGGEATGWRYLDGSFVAYDEVTTFTKADWDRINELIKGSPDLMQYLR